MRRPLLHRQAAGALAAGLVATATLAFGLAAWLGAPWASPALSLALYLAGAALLWAELPRHAPHQRFGLGNSATLLRGGVILSLGGLVLAPEALMAAPWAPLILAGVALALDGFDGRLARREGLASDFGAWFDQELDGLFILILAALAWTSEQLGPWILVIGLYRYLFLLAGRLFPPLARPLPYSGRRRAICAYSVGALIVSLVPVLPQTLTLAAGVSALSLMTFSFGADLWRLMQQHGETS